MCVLKWYTFWFLHQIDNFIRYFILGTNKSSGWSSKQFSSFYCGSQKLNNLLKAIISNWHLLSNDSIQIALIRILSQGFSKSVFKQDTWARDYATDSGSKWNGAWDWALGEGWQYQRCWSTDPKETFYSKSLHHQRDQKLTGHIC